jgi:hypothetical protein
MRRAAAVMLVLGLAAAGCTGAAEETTTVAPPTTTPTDAAPQFDPIHLSGSGTDVVNLVIPYGFLAILQIEHEGSGNFTVRSYTASDDEIELLVNTIGAYQGVRAVNKSDEEVAFLEVTASGGWTITTAPVTSADQFSVSGGASGRGDNILIDPYASPSAERVTLTHDGDGNFAIGVYSRSELLDLLVNEIGAFNGTVLAIPGGFLWDIAADGNWTIEIER